MQKGAVLLKGAVPLPPGQLALVGGVISLWAGELVCWAGAGWALRALDMQGIGH